MPKQNTIPIGTRVRLVHDAERFPHFIVPAGSTGVVVDIGLEKSFAIRMDEPIVSPEGKPVTDWNNEVHWYDIGEYGGYDMPELDILEPPAGAVDHFVQQDALKRSSDEGLLDMIEEGGPTALVEAARDELQRRREERSPSSDEASAARYFVTEVIDGDIEVVATGTLADEAALRAEMRPGQKLWRASEKGTLPWYGPEPPLAEVPAVDEDVERDAVTIVLRYVPVIDGRPEIPLEEARQLWRDALTREAEQIADRHDAELSLHYEDMTS